MSRKIRNATMLRSRQKNNFNKNPNEENRHHYEKQRNFCVSLVRKGKKRYYNHLDVKKDNKHKTVVFRQTKYIRSQHSDCNDVICSDNKQVAEKLNNF